MHHCTCTLQYCTVVYTWGAPGGELGHQRDLVGLLVRGGRRDEGHGHEGLLQEDGGGGRAVAHVVRLHVTKADREAEGTHKQVGHTVHWNLHLPLQLCSRALKLGIQGAKPRYKSVLAYRTLPVELGTWDALDPQDKIGLGRTYLGRGGVVGGRGSDGVEPLHEPREADRPVRTRGLAAPTAFPWSSLRLTTAPASRGLAGSKKESSSWTATVRSTGAEEGEATDAEGEGHLPGRWGCRLPPRSARLEKTEEEKIRRAGATVR